jgi:hypothetical protein
MQARLTMPRRLVRTPRPGQTVACMDWCIGGRAGQVAIWPASLAGGVDRVAGWLDPCAPNTWPEPRDRPYNCGVT